MSDRRWLLPLLVLVVVAGCASQPTPPAPVDTAAIEAKVDSLEKIYKMACAARDTDAVVALYADDADMLPANAPRQKGKAAIRQGIVGLLSLPGFVLDFASVKKLVSENGDMVVDIQSYTMKMSGPKGRTIEDVGKSVTVFKKLNGEWKIVVDTYNTDMPIPGQ